VVGITNGAAFCAYALALWYGSTRVKAGAYTGRITGTERRAASPYLGCVALKGQHMHRQVWGAILLPLLEQAADQC